MASSEEPEPIDIGKNVPAPNEGEVVFDVKNEQGDDARVTIRHKDSGTSSAGRKPPKRE
jgi:hypothetical protein